MEGAFSSQTVLGASTEGRGVGALAQVVLLVAYAPPATKNVRVSHDVLEASTQGRGVIGSSQINMLVAYRTGSVENLNNRSWHYSLDGHTFYVITIGEQGTMVYDQTTKQWAKFQTQGLPGWNMEIGTKWRGDIIAADQQNPIIWLLDPDTFLDDGFKPQIRKVSGALPLRNRAFISNYAFRLTASVGKVSVPNTVPPTVAQVTLSYSDDQGETFIVDETINVDITNKKQTLQWLSLGTMQAPMRIFEIEDVGGITRIGGADAEISEEGE